VFTFRCPKPDCRETYHADEAHIGRHITCRSCGQLIKIDRQPRFMDEHLLDRPAPRSTGRWYAIGIVVACIAAVAFVFWYAGKQPGANQTSGRPIAQPRVATAVWVPVSYGDLVNPNEITQSGDTISEVHARLAHDAGARAQLQPFLEAHGTLLLDALDMVRGAATLPRRTIGDAYPPGAARPAWADLLRGGRYIVAYDGSDLATVFAPGRNAKEAYDAAFGVLRHPLAVLQSSVAGPLRVEAYAYENDYASMELRLNTEPYVFTDTSFGAPAGRKPVDLQVLEAFVKGGAELAGARIDPDDGLVLVGRQGGKPALAGHPASLADLAVAYRAVFHAGHNNAFVSLDPSPDPKRVRVNFGGLLEDTRLGSVVLQSDMRFKTLSSGLDPLTYADLRGTVRGRVPRFMTVAERDLATQTAGKTGWQGTRFWFYPDAVQIQSDLAGRTAYVEKARFTADAERSRADFSTPGAFEAFKKTQLNPSIRANINDLNARYEDYAEAFPELRELTTVARLMAICSWLREAQPTEVDLDGLLAVDLPAWSTPREKPQLLTISILSYADRGPTPAAAVIAHTVVRRIEPLLNQPVEKVFATGKSISAFLRATGAEAGEAATVGGLCRDYVRTRQHLRAFAELVADGMMGAAPGPMPGLERELGRTRTRIEQMRQELDGLKRIMATSAATHNQYLDQYNALVRDYNAELDQHNRLVRSANSIRSVVRTVTTIEGGIDLSPKSFKVSRRVASPELDRVRAAMPGITVGGWTRSPKPSGRPLSPGVPLAWRWNLAKPSDRGAAAANSGVDGAGNRFWLAKDASGNDWKERVTLSADRATERICDSATKQMRIASYSNGKPSEYLVAQRETSGRIVFKRRDAASLIPLYPGAPRWW